MKFRALAREAAIFILVSAVIGSIGSAIAAYRTNHAVTALSKTEPTDKYVIACPDNEVSLGSKSIGNNATEELCVPSNFPTLSSSEQIKILSRNADFAQLPEVEQLKVIIVLVSRFYDEKAQRAGVAPVPQASRDSRVGWLTRYEAVAVWLEGIALILIFIWDRKDAKRSHQETVAQLKVAQDQIKISQNAERAWILTVLGWPPYESLKVVLGTSQFQDEPQLKTTEVILALSCKNEGRSPAWVDKIEGHCEIVQGKPRPEPPANPMQQFPAIGPIAPGNSESRKLNLICSGHANATDSISIFVQVEYRDIFDQHRLTFCGYIVIADHLDRQENAPQRNRNT